MTAHENRVDSHEPQASMAGPSEPAPGMIQTRLAGSAPGEAPPPFGMSRFELEPGAESPLDDHDEAELWMVASGEGSLRYCGQIAVTVRAGDVLRFEPHATHTLRNVGDVTLRVFSVWWQVRC
jgi:mannose-6-phosphate isomerase-like protein (cupin superfamily)